MNKWGVVVEAGLRSEKTESLQWALIVWEMGKSNLVKTECKIFFLYELIVKAVKEVKFAA